MFIEIADCDGITWYINPRYVVSIGACSPDNQRFEIMLTNKDSLLVEPGQVARFVAEAAAMRSRRQLL